ncbi:Ubiquitin-conjugating enzyme E2 6 [Ascosphaera pollenicola]|nr:Ubiquitin-conjugating enzyme E2 6 [Ascosphaera pollenicola]
MNARASSKSGRLVSSLLLSHRCGSARSSWVQRRFLVSGGNHSVSARLSPRYQYSDRRYGFGARGRSELGLPLLAAFGSIGFLITPDQKLHENDATASEERISRSHQQEEVPDGWLLRTLRQLRKWLHTHIYESIATGFRFLHLVVVFVPVIATVPAIWIGRRVKDRSNEPVGRLWWYELLVCSMESAGATFIKLGQWAASRTDIFPPELCNLLSTLHSNAPSHPFEVTRETICRAFGGHSFDDIFEEFDEQPLGVGAIAQVYKAKLRPGFAVPRDDIEDMHDISSQVKRNVDLLVKKAPPVMAPSSYVAVKVLHPGIEKTVERDLCIMNFIAKIINMIPTMEWLSFPDEVKQFGYMMRLQLNLKTEASHLSTFRKKFRGRTTAYFPYPYEQYTTREVLVEEFAQGIPLAIFLKNGAGAYHKEIAHEGLDA